MFGFFKKKQPPPIKTSPEMVRAISEGVRMLVGIQLTLASRTESDLLESKFTLGYLIGVCDALSQKRGVPNGENTLVMLAIFGVMFPDKPEAASLAMKLSDDQEFFKGQMAGGQETMLVLSGKQKAAFGLIDHWNK
jgi:hypothetical protein